MVTAEENVCCHKLSCVTDMGWFDSVVLNRDVIDVFDLSFRTSFIKAGMYVLI